MLTIAEEETSMEDRWINRQTDRQPAELSLLKELNSTN